MAIIKKFLLLCLVILLGAFPAWSATTHNVSTVTELTNAINSANAGDIINLSAGTYSLTSELTINKNITLKGNTASDTIIERSSSATSKFRNINISGSAVILQNLTIQNASYDQYDLNGAGIYYNASGTLSIDNCIITNNQSSTPGGGIYNDKGTANITNCTITGNNASYGGGIYNNNGTANITNCTITGNTASYGGGIYNFRTANITNCTITGNNAASRGGGIYNNSTANITNCTITGNNARYGGREIYNNNNNSATVSALNTLIWNQSNAIDGNLTLTNCATPSGIGTNPVTISSWPNPVSSSVTVNGVTHTVFTIDNNYSALKTLVNKGIKSGDQTPTYDQIGTLRANLPTIGALEGTILPIEISCDVELGVTKGYSRDITLSADLNDDFKEWPISWRISSDVNGITLSNNGVLTVSEDLTVGIYSVDIIASITSNNVTHSDDKIITVSVYPYPTVIINGTISDGTAGSAFTQNLSASITVDSADSTVTPTWSYTGNLPNGITFNNGSFSGTPTQSGNFEITVTASADVTTIDSHNIIISRDKTFRLSISAATVTISDPSNGTVGQSYTYDFTQNVTPNTLTYTWTQKGTLPRGLSFDSGVLSGIPTRSGSYPIKIIATSAGGTGSKDITLVINSSGTPSYPGGQTGSKESTHNATDSQTGGSYSESYSTFTELSTGSAAGVTIASVDLKIFTESDEITYIANNELTMPVSFEVYISQDSTYYNYDRYNLSVDIANLPAGLTISGDGVFNNVSLDSHDFTVYVTGSHNVVGSSYDLTITAQVTVSGDDPILIASADHTVKVKFILGELVSMDINFDDKLFKYERTEKFASSFDFGDILTGVTGYFSSKTSSDLESYSLNFISDSLPSGVTIESASIRISESAVSGSYDINIVAAVTSGEITTSNDKHISLILYPYPVIVISEDSKSGIAGSAFTESVNAKATVNSQDASITPVWSYSGTLPAGVTLNNNGNFTGTPTVSGDYTITLKVSADITTIDSHDIRISSDKTFTFSLAAANVTISGNPSTPPSGTVGQNYSYTLSADPAILTYTWSATGLPRGLTLNNSQGVLSGAPTKSGSYPITITAASPGGTGTANYTLVISSSGSPSYSYPETGTRIESHNQTDSSGAYSESVSTFNEFDTDSGGAQTATGYIIASVDIKITTKANELSGIAGYDFAEPVKFYVNISQDSEYHYTNYDLSVDISNLTDGFEVSGDKEFNNISFDSHDFTIYIKGLTNSSFTQEDIIISASVIVSGDDPVLITSADHNISITIAPGILTSSTLSVNDSAIEGVFTEKFAASMDLSDIVSDVMGYFSDATSRSVKSASTITFSSLSLPEGFTIEGSMLNISESAAAGSYDIAITATANNNGITSSGTKNISVTLYSYPTITINTSEINSGKVSENYSQSFSASATVNNSDASITPTWSLASGTLPAGLVLNSEGTISGTPTQSGSFDINIKVSADVTTVDNHNIIISADKEFILSIIASQDVNIQIVSYEVTLSGNNEITLTEGTAGSLTFTPVVSVHYSDGSEKLLTPGEYSATWVINENFLTVYRMSFNNGTLTISENTPADKYNIAVSINISANNLTASASKYFNVVIESSSGQSGAQSKDFIIDVGGDGESVTLTINNNSGNPVESLADITNKLSQAEKELITEIDLNNNTTIKDLAGIAEFKNLSSLNAGGCESLKEVDVSGCNKLEYLDVSSCDLEILLVDGCESLKELICGNNLIETLDLSTCPNLEILDCQANNLSELNIESNKLLIEIDCSYNNLPALDIAQSFFTVLNNLICNGQEILGINAELDGNVYRININTLGNVSRNIEISANTSTSAIMPDKIYNVKAYNKASEEIIINYDSQTGIFESSEKPASVKYYYITGFKDVDMDVTLQITGEDPAPTPTPTPDNQFASGGGGCNSAFGLIALMALAVFRRKK